MTRAASNGHADFCKYLLSHNLADVNELDDTGSSAALEASNEATARVIMQHGGNVLHVSPTGFTMVMSAAVMGSVPLLIELIETYFVDPTMRTADGEDATHYAAGNDRLEALQWLLDNTELEATTPDKEGVTAIHLLARHGHLDLQ